MAVADGFLFSAWCPVGVLYHPGSWFSERNPPATATITGQTQISMQLLPAASPEAWQARQEQLW